MAHLDYARLSGQWTREMVPGAGDWYRFDVNQYKGLDGDNGGACAPSAPIVIGGAGVQLTTAASLMSGGVRTQTGGRCVVGHADGTFPTLGPTRSRTIEIPILDCVFVDPANGGQFSRVFDDAKGTGILGNPAGGYYPLYFEIPSRYLHSGARLATLGVNFVVTKRPSALPPTAFSMLAAYKTAAGSIGLFNPSLVANWAAGIAQTAGNYIVASSQSTNRGYYYAAQNNGTTAGVGHEPAWPTVIGATVVDNTVTWKCIGRVGWYPFFGATVDTYYNQGKPQLIAYDFDGLTGAFGTSNIIDVTTYRYQLAIEALDPTVLVTSLFASFDTIGTMQFG